MSCVSEGHAAWRELLLRRSHDDKPWLIVDVGPTTRPRRRVVTYRELSIRAGLVSSSLCALLPRGSRVLIVMDNSVESAVIGVATLAAGMVAVPIAPPFLAHVSLAWLATTEQTYRDCEAALLLGPTALLDGCALPEAMRKATFAALLAPGKSDQQDFGAGMGGDLALLQYTSGTTARARGVRLSHGQIVGNVAGIGQMLSVRPDDVGLCWLPLSHDMGLIGSLLFATYWGISLVLMKPQTFLMRPESWLRAIDRERVTLCAAPNSAYWLCAAKIPEHKLEGLDLSSWRAAINGAELIHSETLSAFSKRFRRFGFRAEALCPAYGLAECATAVCLAPVGRPPGIDRVDRDELERTGRAVVANEGALATREVASVGRPLPLHEVRIVTEGSAHELVEREVGAIQIRGPSVTQGYFRAAASAEGTPDHEGWLATGDRGYLASGELYVLGRTKATLKRAGRSIDCAYVENAIRSVAGVRAGRVAAIGVSVATEGAEQLVIVAETDLRRTSERAALTAKLRAVVRAILAFSPDVVLLSAPGTIPRTTSGKVRHEALRAAYLAGELDPVEGGARSAREAKRAPPCASKAESGGESRP